MNQGNGDATDKQDMARLAAGHDGSLNTLMDRHGPRLFQYLLRSLQNEAEADDLAQETFVRVYQNRHKFRADQKFTTWLYAIASNLVRDRFRWRSRHPQVSIELDPGSAAGPSNLRAPELSPDQHLEAAEQAQAVARAIAALPEDLRQPLILSVYEDLPQAEIAQILDCSIKAVETRVYRARKILARDLRVED